jgi:hypothetical protein
VEGFGERQPELVDLPGVRRFGDRLSTVENMGGNLVQIRPARTGGNVIVPEEWGWDEGDAA